MPRINPITLIPTIQRSKAVTSRRTPKNDGARTMNYALTCLVATLAGVALAAEPPSEMTLDQALEQLKTYDYGQNDRPLRVIELQAVRTAADAASKAQVAERLAAILSSPNLSQAAKVFVCQQLLVVGTEAQVPLLAKLLDDPQTAEIARYTLDAIPGEASLAALRGRCPGCKDRHWSASSIRWGCVATASR